MDMSRQSMSAWFAGDSGSMQTTWPNNECLRSCSMSPMGGSPVRLDIVTFLILSNQRTPRIRRDQFPSVKFVALRYDIL